MIIGSILDNDLYSFTVQQAIQSQYPGKSVAYQFRDRKPDRYREKIKCWPGGGKSNFESDLMSEIEPMRDLRLRSDEEDYLRSLGFFSDNYLKWLREFRFDPSQIKIGVGYYGDLSLEIRGKWEETVLWEIPILAIISEMFYRDQPISDEERQQQEQLLEGKKFSLAGFNYSEFGTRRRRSFDHHDRIVSGLKGAPGFNGTSNVFFAKKYGVKPIGTMSHQWIMGVSALEGLRHSNRYAMRAWNAAYKGRLGIALTDTYGTPAFWEDFDSELSRLFDGVRHDSGDPIAFGLAAISHYKSLGIDPSTKTIVFSDGLNIDSCREIASALRGQIRLAFGIGTNFTNDFLDNPPLNIVIKMVNCDGVPVVKLGDGNGKEMGDFDAVRVARWTFRNQPLDIR